MGHKHASHACHLFVCRNAEASLFVNRILIKTFFAAMQGLHCLIHSFSSESMDFPRALVSLIYFTTCFGKNTRHWAVK